MSYAGRLCAANCGNNESIALYLMRRLLIDPFAGRQRLWIVFWLYWLAGRFIIERIIWSLSLDQASAIKTTIYCTGIWAVYSCIALWRCAPNTDFRWLGYAARVIAVLNLVLVPVAYYLVITDQLGATVD